MTTNYTITQENQEIVVRVNKAIFSQEKLAKFLDYLDLESVKSSSKLTQIQADQLAQEIDQHIWESIKDRVLGA
jgi:uncharacterized protein YacL (UPF0231 family)